MIVERHYDDETLIGLLGINEAARDPHLAVCNTCSENLASYRAVADVLGEDAAWDMVKRLGVTTWCLATCAAGSG